MARIKQAILASLLFGFMGTANAIPVTVDVVGLGAKWEFDGPMFESGSCEVCGTLDPSPETATFYYDLTPGSYVFQITGYLSSYDVLVNGQSIGSGGGEHYFNVYDITAVPEPGPLVLFGLGLICFAVARRRVHRKT